MKNIHPLRTLLFIAGLAMIVSAGICGMLLGSWSYMGATLVLLAFVPGGTLMTRRKASDIKTAPCKPFAVILLVLLLIVSAAFAVWQATEDPLVMPLEKSENTTGSFGTDYEGINKFIPDWPWIGSLEVDFIGSPGSTISLRVDNDPAYTFTLDDTAMTRTVPVEHMAAAFYIRTDDTGFSGMAGFRAVSRINWPKLFMWLCCTWGTLFALFALYRRRLDWAAFALITGLGLTYVVTKQVTVPYGWDEYIHRTQTFLMLGKGIHSLEGYIANARTWFIGYIPAAFGTWIAQLLQLPEQVALRLGNMTGVLGYAFLAMLAVRHTPRCKLTVLALAALPTCLFEAGNYSYDGVVIGCSLLFAALIAEYCERGKPLTQIELLGLIVPMTLAALTKPVHILILLMGFFLPQSCFSDKRQRLSFRVWLIVLMLWCQVSLVMPGVYANVAGGDARCEGADSGAQLAFMLSQPLAFAKIIGRYILTGIPQCYAQVPLYNLGSYSGIPKLGLALTAILLLVCPFAVRGEDSEHAPFTAKRRVLLFLISILPMIVLTITQYFVSSKVGGSEVEGVQFRYTLPSWLLMAWALLPPQSWRMKLKRLTPLIELCVVGLLALASLWTVYHIVLPIWWL